MLSEAIFVLTSFYKYKRADILKLQKFVDIQDFIVEDLQLNLRAIEVYAKTKLHYVDAWLYAKSKMDKTKLATLDNSLNKEFKQTAKP